MSNPYFVSRAYDFGWFVLPGIVTAVLALIWGLSTSGEESAKSKLGVWIVGVLLVDVAHVYASLYRTYLDPGQRERHFKRLIWAPLLCGVVGFGLHAMSAKYFWTVLAYIAIFHFIKQHVGFAMLYVRAGRESDFDRRLTEVAIWAGTLVPIIFWHAYLPRRFNWFREGDLLHPSAFSDVLDYKIMAPLSGLRELDMQNVAGTVATLFLLLEIPVLLLFMGRRIQLALRGSANPMVFWLALIPALNWHLGIVIFNDDRIFTITNVVMHGIPYMALVWLTGGQHTVARAATLLRPKTQVPKLLLAAAFYGLLLSLAFAEEAAWDRLIWHDHPQLFGSGGLQIRIDSLLEALVVALLAVPQATHYLLDRWIWRVGPENPELAMQLNLARFKAPSLASEQKTPAG